MARYRIKEIRKKGPRVYRIKQEANAAAPQLPDEYWREVKPGQERDLDFAEIAALNEDADLAEDDGAEPSRRRAAWLKIALALLVIVSFLAWSARDLTHGNIDFHIIKRSAELSQDEALAQLKKAVVVVESSAGQGSGFNVAADGLIVTNRHVVSGAGIVSVSFPDEDGSRQTYYCSSWRELDDVDLAVLDIDGTDLPFVRVSSQLPSPGADVVFIGNPLGYDWTIAEGTVNGLVTVDNRYAIYFDGPVQPGSSGSPLFNDSNFVIGVVFASVAGEDNTGLAIPISYLTLSSYEE